jgi:hypothetical protein
MGAYEDGTRQALEDRKHHVREAVRLRSLAAIVTTQAVKARVLRQAQEHTRLAGLAVGDGASPSAIWRASEEGQPVPGNRMSSAVKHSTASRVAKEESRPASSDGSRPS